MSKLCVCPKCHTMPILPSANDLYGTEAEINCHDCGQYSAWLTFRSIMTDEERKTATFLADSEDDCPRYEEKYRIRAIQELITLWNYEPYTKVEL